MLYFSHCSLYISIMLIMYYKKATVYLKKCLLIIWNLFIMYLDKCSQNSNENIYLRIKLIVYFKHVCCVFQNGHQVFYMFNIYFKRFIVCLEIFSAYFKMFIAQLQNVRHIFKSFHIYKIFKIKRKHQKI